MPGPLPKTVVLLGAGASADAGLPLTSALASAVVQDANASINPWIGTTPSTRALNLVYGAMVGHQSAHGGDPLQAVNIETLISAVRLLTDRDAHEAAPFVSSWIDGLSDIGTVSQRADQGERILNIVTQMINQGSGAGRDVEAAVSEIARRASRPDLKQPLEGAESFIFAALVKLLGHPKDVSYLQPLADLARSQDGGLDIITLNYDLTVERFASSAGVHIHRGIDDWAPGARLDFPPVAGAINLVKVHGSLDWVRSENRASMWLQGDPATPVRVVVAREGQKVTRPWIVVGDREKLATEGPTLSLLYAAQGVLYRAERLVVVGYSFGDSHINAIIRDWLAADAARTITVLDYDWSGSSGSPGASFRAALIDAYAPNLPAHHGGERPFPRMEAIEGTARAKLSEAIWSLPQAFPAQPVELDSRAVDGRRVVTLTLRAPTLTNVTFSAVPAGPDQSFFSAAALSDVLDWAEPDPLSSPHPTTMLRLPEWREGMSVATVVSSSAQRPIVIRISGTRAIGTEHFEVLIE